MKKIIFSIIATFLFSSLIFGQQKQHKIVFDFTKADTASFSTMIRHAKNIMSMTGNAKLEIVCHGPGLDLLIKYKTTVQKEIEELNKLNVVFAACNETMKRRGIVKSKLLSQAIIVPAAILEISSKEQEGWSYIKEGY